MGQLIVNLKSLYYFDGDTLVFEGYPMNDGDRSNATTRVLVLKWNLYVRGIHQNRKSTVA